MSDYTPSIQELARAYEAVFVEARRPEARAEAARAIVAHDAEKHAEWEAEQRERIASEIEAEGADTSDGLYYDAYINGLRRAIEIVRDGR